MRQLSPGFLELSDEPSVVLDPVDRRDAEDGAADAALVVVVVGLAAETEVEAPERGSLEYKHKLFCFQDLVLALNLPRFFFSTILRSARSRKFIVSGSLLSP